MNLPNTTDILQELSDCSTQQQLEAFHATYLGRKWSINSLFKELRSVSNQEKKQYGSQIKQLFETVDEAFQSRQDHVKKMYRDNELSKEIVDISTPAPQLSLWHQNLQHQLRRHVEEIFLRMWFAVEYWHELVSVYENFESVNIPSTHPATEMHDTLYVKSHNDQNMLLRTHTSAHQSELIKKYGPACKFVVPGRVYRNENLDATHDVAFWQVEWVVIDKNIHLWHFKSMMSEILQAVLESDSIKLRLRPAYFPFVEPWFEVDAHVTVWGKTKRMEILGAWMIHPHVLEQAWVDPKKYSGFAFGLGMTRLVAVRYWLDDIRLLTNWDIRFARSIHR